MGSLVVPASTLDARDPFLGTPYRSVRRLRARKFTEIHEVESSEGRHLAKILRPECLPLLQVVERIRLEGDILAALSDQHVVRLHNRGRTPDDCPYLVLERLVGHTLRREIVRRGSLPVLEAVELTLQLLSGLSAVHEVGVVHRDLKPDNLFLCRTKQGIGRLKILDFCFAKAFEDPTSITRIAPLAISTDDREFVGGYRYVAPEQIVMGKRVDHRADLYLVGLVLHALVTGREPFHDVRNRRELLDAQLEEMLYPPSPDTAARVPRELFVIIRRATSKEPGARFQSAAEFTDELREFVEMMRVAGSRVGREPPRQKDKPR
jgi:serine/threonine protein kinase